MSCMVDGDPNAPILIVGIAPGREELDRDKPFVGGSGRLLWSLAGSTRAGGASPNGGFGREDCYIINTIGEWPEKPQGVPSEKQLEKYWDQFDQAISVFKGRVIIALGRVAFWRCTGIKGGIESWRGYLVLPSEADVITRVLEIRAAYKTNTKTHKKGDPHLVRVKKVAKPVIPESVEWIVPTLHPAGVMRSGLTTLPALAADLRRAVRALNGKLKPCRTHFVHYPVVVGAAEPHAFDIETGGITGGITRIAIAHGLDTWTALWDGSIRDAARACLNRTDCVKVAHNIGFDLPRLRTAGVPIPDPIWDTMLAAQLLQPDLYKGLNSVASLYLDRGRWKHQSETRPDYYNANDASATLELYHVLHSELAKTGQLELFEGTIMPAVRVLVGMTERGIKMDPVRRQQWLEELQSKQINLMDLWRARVGDVNPLSPTQISKLLYGTYGLPTQYNKVGGVTTGEGGLVELLAAAADPNHIEAIKLLIDIREVTKLRSTYAETPLADDGCIHPSYLPAAKDTDEFGKGLAGTGRITAKEPNIQNQPPSSRRLYVPHNPGEILLEADFSQIELRVAAALSDDQALLEALAQDVHSVIQQALSCDRTRAKNIVYGSIYGAGPRKLAAVLRSKGIPTTESECRKLQDRFFGLYPRLARWRTNIVSSVSADRYLSNPFGRRRYFYRGSADAPAALDFLPQSTAADIMWAILRPLDEAMTRLGGAVLTTIHDSVLVEIPLPAELEAVVELRRVMEREWLQVAPGFQVPVKIKRGLNWGEMS